MKADVPVKSVGRFIAVMREINANGPLSLMQLARATGTNYSTTLRIVQTLQAHHLIEQAPNTRSYTVAAMALSLSHGFQFPHRLAATARPTIEDLTRRIGWPVAIMTRSGASMIARASTHHLTSLNFGPCPPGSEFPILHSASGHAFLAHASWEERTGVLEGVRRLDPHSPALFELADGKLFGRIRDEGYATDDRNIHVKYPGKTSSISVPILHAGAVHGTLTAVFFSSAMPLAEAVRRYRINLKTAARAIADGLVDCEPQGRGPDSDKQHGSPLAVKLNIPAFSHSPIRTYSLQVSRAGSA